jgi:hypothetical protein
VRSDHSHDDDNKVFVDEQWELVCVAIFQELRSAAMTVTSDYAHVGGVNELGTVRLYCQAQSAAYWLKAVA